MRSCMGVPVCEKFTKLFCSFFVDQGGYKLIMLWRTALLGCSMLVIRYEFFLMWYVCDAG